MKSSSPSSPTTPTGTPSPRRQSFSPKRIALLLGLLILLAILLPISRRYLFTKPPKPPASAGVKGLMHYYAGRTESDPSDVEAYVELGKLEEANGFFMDALKHLYIARALGAKDTQILLPLGRSLTYLARFDEAQTELKKAISLMPDSLEAATNLAGMYDAYGDSEEASKSLRDFLARHPEIETGKTPAAKNDIERLMFCFLQAGDEEMALKLANDIVILAPDQPEGYSISGKILLSRHDAKGALQRLEKAVQLAPNEAALLYTYGLALSQNGREEEAIKQWEKTVTLNSNAIDAYYRLAESYGKKKDYNKTAKILQILALYDSNNLTVVNATALAFDKIGQKSAAAYWQSIAARIRRDYPAALNYARQVVADPTWHNRGLASMAEAYRGMNRLDAYLDTMRQLTAKHTAEDDFTLADAYGNADRLTDQIQLLKSALGKQPRDPAKIHYLLSQVALRKGLRDEAESELEQAATLASSDPLYHQELGNLYLERRSAGDRLQRAIREFKQLVQLKPDEYVGYQKLGIAYSAAGDYRRAAHNLEHVLDLQPGEGATYQELGRVYARLGDTSSSEQMFHLYQQYVSYDLQKKTLLTKSSASRKDAAAQVALAQFLENSGDYPAAIRYYRLASNLRPNDTALKTKIQQLYSLLGQRTN